MWTVWVGYSYRNSLYVLKTLTTTSTPQSQQHCWLVKKDVNIIIIIITLFSWIVLWVELINKFIGEISTTLFYSFLYFYKLQVKWPIPCWTKNISDKSQNKLSVKKGKNFFVYMFRCYVIMGEINIPFFPHWWIVFFFFSFVIYLFVL